MPCSQMSPAVEPVAPRGQGASASRASFLAGLVMLLALERTAEATRSGAEDAPAATPAHGGAPAAASSGCAWTVHYDAWIPSFDPVPYQHPGYGEHCLEVCCQDPACHGLALDSSEQWSCFRYSQLPARIKLSKHPAQPLGDGLWLLHRKQAWSVFVKEAAGSSSSQQPVHPFVQHALSWSRQGVQHQGAAAPHASIKPVAHHDSCRWEVHYDMWEPSFINREYRPNVQAAGGAHCFEACCRDETCTGIQMLSSELAQCYKYKTLPDFQGRPGRDLGDSRWLLERKAAWSVFVKAGTVPARDQSQQLREVHLDQHLRFMAAGGHHAQPGEKHLHFTYPGHQAAAAPAGTNGSAEQPEKASPSQELQQPKLPTAAPAAPAAAAAAPADSQAPAAMLTSNETRTGDASDASDREHGDDAPGRQVWPVRLIGTVLIAAYIFRRAGAWKLLCKALRGARASAALKRRGGSYGTHELADGPI